jgi:hypothetical protein
MHRYLIYTQGKTCSGVAGSLSIDEECFLVDVLDVITRSMIASILRNTSACEDTGCGNTKFKEAHIV